MSDPSLIGEFTIYCKAFALHKWRSPLSGGPPHNIAIAVDLSHSTKSVVRFVSRCKFIKPTDFVYLLHVQADSIDFYGADWGKIDALEKDLDSDFDDETRMEKARELGKILEEELKMNLSYEIRIVRDENIGERLILEAQRLELNLLVMGSSKFDGQLEAGSIEHYCVRSPHRVCTILTVPYTFT